MGTTLDLMIKKRFGNGIFLPAILILRLPSEEFAHGSMDWWFTSEDARIKFIWIYPNITLKKYQGNIQW